MPNIESDWMGYPCHQWTQITRLKPNYPTRVVESDKGILGGLIMVFKNNEASIAIIVVDPKFQGHGIGGALMKFAQLKARGKNIHALKLTTQVLLDEHISLYRHLGWKETGRDETRVFMQKQI
jgi:GNAT superfamily N-acetyltransferase